MKTYSAIIATLVFFVITSCKVQQETMQINLQTGSTFSQKMTVVSDIDQSMEGMEMNIKMTIDAIINYKVLSEAAESYEMEVSYGQMTMKMESPFMNMEFNSLNQDTTDIFSRIMGGMVNQSFILEMSKKGKVLSVKGFDKIIANMMSNLNILDSAKQEQLTKQFKDAYGEKALANNFNMTTAILPEGEVAEGDKWNINTQVETTTKLNIASEYELKEVTKNDYHIIGKSTMTTDESGPMLQADGTSIGYNLTGTMNSDLMMNKATGWVRSAKITQNMEGTVSATSPLGGMEDMSIPMKINSVIEITDL